MHIINKILTLQSIEQNRKVFVLGPASARHQQAGAIRAQMHRPVIILGGECCLLYSFFRQLGISSKVVRVFFG